MKMLMKIELAVEVESELNSAYDIMENLNINVESVSDEVKVVNDGVKNFRIANLS